MEKTSEKNIIKLFVSFLGVMAISAFPALFMFFQNAGEAHFDDIIPVMLLFMGTGAILFALSFLITRNIPKAGLITALFLIVFLNYTLFENLIQRFIPALRYWHIAPVLLVVLLHAAWAVWKKVPDDVADIVMMVMSGVLVFMIILNGAMAIPGITTRRNAEKEAKRQAEQVIVSEAEMPNFYFLLFDEFSTIPFMQKNFHYDNSELLNKLEALDFNISQTGHNESIWTSAITANLFQLEYVGDYYHNTSEELFALRSENPVFEQLRDAGYTIVSPAGAEFYGLSDALGKQSRASTINGEDLETLLLRRTVAYPVFNKSSVGEAQVIIDQLEYLKNGKQNFPEYNQFILAHMDLPHTPFMFNSDGSVRKTFSNSWRDLELYLTQYQYTSAQIYEIAESIVRNDPNAIIWILSDHGARANIDGDFFFSDEDMENFFNAVYYRGENLDIEGLSGINTFRVLLNKLLGTEYEMIPLP